MWALQSSAASRHAAARSVRGRYSNAVDCLVLPPVPPIAPHCPLARQPPRWCAWRRPLKPRDSLLCRRSNCRFEAADSSGAKRQGTGSGGVA